MASMAQMGKPVSTSANMPTWRYCPIGIYVGGAPAPFEDQHICRATAYVAVDEALTMTDVTARDRIWAAALEAMATRFAFRIDYLIHLDEELDQGNRATIRRTLRAMVDLGWLDHRPGSPRYTIGDKMEELKHEGRMLDSRRD